MISTAFSDIAVIPYTVLFHTKEHEIAVSGMNNLYDPAISDYYEFITKDIHFIRIASFSSQQQYLAFQSEKAFISLVFSFKCRHTYINRVTKKIFADIEDNQCGIIFINTQVFNSCYIAEPGSELYIINITVDYFKRFLSAVHPLYDNFYSSLNENTPVILNEKSIAILPRMKSLLNDMFQTGHQQLYKVLYVKSKFIELLMLQFQVYENSIKTVEENFVNDTNYTKMQEARGIIDANIAQPCTLVDLALQVGTNECYLKKHFKQVYGTTVFGYLHKQRMEKSKEMLLNENKKIAEVAKLVGYKHATHFTTAFKKYFGYLPHQIKLILLSLIQTPEFNYSMETAIAFSA